MIFTLKRKLVAALLIANLVLIAVMASLMYFSFHRGFTNYLRQVEIEELLPFSKALIYGYSVNGSWQFLQHNAETWGLFIKFLPGGDWQDLSPDTIVDKLKEPSPHPPGRRILPPTGSPPDNRQGFSSPTPRPPGRRNFPPASSPPDNRQDFNPPTPINRDFTSPGQDRSPRPLSDSGSLNWRLKLLDTNKHIVFGKADDSADPLLIPLQQGGETIGWLSVTRVKWLERGLADKFLGTQFVAVCISAFIALAISLLVSLPLGRSILKPVTLIIEGIRNIASGNLDHKIRWTNRDEFKKLVEDVNNLATILDENKELRRTMMADISHELRTPLAVLQAEIEAIQDGIRTCNNEQLESLHKSVRSLSHLIDDLFDLSLSDAGKLTYLKREIDINALLERSYELYSNLFQKKEIAFSRELSKRTIIFADPERLTQVFSNILNNSYRYTDRPGKVRISTQLAPEYIHIRFEDSPPAIPKENLEDIFNRFFRVDKSRSRALGGAGLGLSLCRSILEAHHGKIVASHSALGGVAITISLPLQQRDMNEDQNGK